RALVGANSSPAAQITGAAGWWGLGSAAGVLAGRGGSYTLSSDVISGGAGRDFLLGDSGAILPIVGAASAAGQLAVRVLPIGEIGATLSAELAYVYDYLPFSRLHDRTGAGLAVSVSGFADRLSGDAGNDL